MPCTFIKKEAPTLFDLLTDIFSYKLKMSEIGITDLFIYKLVAYCKTHSLSNVTIFHAKQESVYGADIDLFVEQSSGKYLWFSLQAKVMNHKGVYRDLRIKKKSPQQWEKLKDNETKHGCKAFYLFYNGDYTVSPGLPAPALSDCQGLPTTKEYGYGIVERQYIDSHFTAGAARAAFTDFYPYRMDTLKRLLCCDFDNGSGALNEFDLLEIHTAAPYFQLYPIIDHLDSGIFANIDVGTFASRRIIISKAISDTYNMALEKDLLVLRPYKLEDFL
ncbi:MAG TPA: DUF6615 family protein [Puia sp.]|nr:DUF6615 family protein [Puia sp.]